MSAGHDDGELELEAKLEEPDNDACELLVSEIVDWGRVVSEIKQIHCVGSALYGKRVGAKGIEDLQDRVKHRGSEGTSGRVVAESHAEIAVHGSRVESAGERLRRAWRVSSYLERQVSNAPPSSTCVLIIANVVGSGGQVILNLRGSTSN